MEISKFKKVTIATNTIDLSNYLNLTKKYFNKKKNLERKYKFLFISRIEKEKEPFYALQLLKELLNEGFNVEFKVIGSGTQNKKFINSINKLNLNNHVLIYGSIVNQAEIISIAKDSHFLLHPGVIGLSALVSLSLGIPVITTPSKKQMPEFEIFKK